MLPVTSVGQILLRARRRTTDHLADPLVMGAQVCLHAGDRKPGDDRVLRRAARAGENSFELERLAETAVGNR